MHLLMNSVGYSAGAIMIIHELKQTRVYFVPWAANPRRFEGKSKLGMIRVHFVKANHLNSCTVRQFVYIYKSLYGPFTLLELKQIRLLFYNFSTLSAIVTGFPYKTSM